jgi:hypothetical protein
MLHTQLVLFDIEIRKREDRKEWTDGTEETRIESAWDGG